MKPDLIRHIEGENIGRFPVWMMRQAGRYLPQYRELRKKYTFWESVHNPEIAAEISLQPLKVLPVDAVIFFSDILTLPEGLGVPVSMVESVGPVIEKPLDQVGAYDLFEGYNAAKHTPYVSQALKIISRELTADKTLIGFAGAPWTVASYLIEGKGSKNFSKIKGWMYRDPKGLAEALRMLGKATTLYLRDQISSGAHIYQLFDTWASEIPRDFFENHYRPILEEIFSGLKGTPSIYFAKGAQHLWPLMQDLQVSGLGVDSLQPLREAEKALGTKSFLQGNLDPVVLLECPEGTVRKEARTLVKEAIHLKRPAILNLGHGILPHTPFENVKAFVEESRTFWI